METRGRSARFSDYFGLERNVVAVAAAMFLLGFGENLWKGFLPKYLQALGAPVLAIGLFGTVRDFLDGAYQYPGGWIADRYGRRRALLFFVGLASIGYVIYALAPSWPFVLAGLVFGMAWTSMASPTLFAVVGDSLPRERRAIGFTVQAVLKRLPIVVAPTLGGLAIAAYGVLGGIRLGLAVTVALALVTLAVVARVRIRVLREPVPTNIRGVWRSLPSPLKWLLLSDVFIRTCEGLVDVFLVIYATEVVGVSAPRYGALIAIQMATAILVYVPASKIADRAGRKPFVIATFLCFAAFPLAVVLSRSFLALAAAFVVGGLREVGEPARKAMIVDFSRPELRARSIGLYYLVRSAAIAPAAFTGGLLWKIDPSIPFLVAGAVGIVGTVLFTATVEERFAA
ncbi:MAG TPA: MFS transporter [Thermoanaerobaculia bacterium]|jgi:MFS family permease|nr:MFS transporter [Thermoanaerobaculia bacterium]